MQFCIESLFTIFNQSKDRDFVQRQCIVHTMGHWLFKVLGIEGTWDLQNAVICISKHRQLFPMDEWFIRHFNLFEYQG